MKKNYLLVAVLLVAFYAQSYSFSKFSVSVPAITNATCPNAGIDGNILKCDIDSFLINLSDIIIGEDSGGTWTRVAGTGGIFDATAGTFIPLSGCTTSSFVYTIVGVSPCVNDTSMATITINASVNPGTLAGNQNICVGSTATFISTTNGGTWSSSNPAVATINPTNGLVTGVAAGNATMTYTVTGIGACPNATATRTVTVTAPPQQPSLQGSQGVCVSSFTIFSASVPGGTWSSSDSNIAMVDTTGFIMGMSPGTATITYTISGSGGCASVSATRTVTVPSTPLVSLTSEPSTASQVVCINTPITPIVYAIGPVNSGASDAYASGLPQGVVGSFNAGIFTISGSATVEGIFPYTVSTIGWCGNASSTGILTVKPSISSTIFCDPAQVTGPNSVFFDWSNVFGASGYQYSYSINSGPEITGSTSLSHYEIFGVLSGQSVLFTLTDAVGAACFLAATTTCTNLASESFETDKFQSFPNPVNDVLHLTNADIINHVSIVNTLGQSILNKEYQSKSVEVDMSDLAPGIYIVRIASGNAMKTIRIIKE